METCDVATKKAPSRAFLALTSMGYVEVVDVRIGPSG
jgi:hypothetical protein